ncbi:MAG: HAD family hydrolase [Coprobacillus sp.]|nr:HAD family hydrolase [Coprobacillus sp.]
MKEKILYVSDLDGTLLRSDETISQLTSQTINDLVEKGMIFSYATARSYQTAHKVTKGLKAKIPLIIYNGTLIVDNESQDILLAHYFGNSEIKELINDLTSHQIYPIVYSYINQKEKFSFIEELNTKGMQNFIYTRQGDIRKNPVKNINQLYLGDCFYVTCIDEYEKLKPFYEKYKNKYYCLFQEDIYLHSQWLELMPLKASKSSAIQELKDYLNCHKVVVFGDGNNDIDMFSMADEAYAVENAVQELKDIATQIIPRNDEDGVAKWLLQNVFLDK